MFSSLHILIYNRDYDFSNQCDPFINTGYHSATSPEGTGGARTSPKKPNFSLITGYLFGAAASDGHLFLGTTQGNW